MFRLSRAAAGAACAAALLLAAGCGGSLGTPGGKVTLGGNPVADASLTFLPAANPDAVASGVTGPDGTYRLDYGTKRGLAPGKCTVRVTVYTLKSGKPLPGGEQGAALKGDDTKTVQHTYVFETDVPAGASTLDFELNQGKKE